MGFPPNGGLKQGLIGKIQRFSTFNPFSVYPGTVSGSMTRSHSVYPVTVTLLQSATALTNLEGHESAITSTR